MSSTLLSSHISLKVVVLGDEKVGKTVLCEQLSDSLNPFTDFGKPTIGIDYLFRFAYTKSVSYKMMMWDASGNVKFGSIIPPYLRDANICFLVYDTGKRASFESIEETWYPFLSDSVDKRKMEQMYVVMIGVNKGPTYRGRDYGDMVKKEEAEEMARRLNVDLFVEIATADKDQVEQFLSHLITLFPEERRTDVLGRCTGRGSEPLSKQRKETRRKKWVRLMKRIFQKILCCHKDNN
jgi:small GTP-binding protein